MIKKIVTIILVAATVLIHVGCKYDEDFTTTYKKGPFDSILYETEVIVEQTLSVSYKDEIITRIIFAEKYTIEDGNFEDLESYATQVDLTFENDIFQVEGFEYTSELTEDSFINTITSDYTKINYMELSDDAIIFFFGKDNIDEDFNLSYEKYIKTFIENGFTQLDNS